MPQGGGGAGWGWGRSARKGLNLPPHPALPRASALGAHESCESPTVYPPTWGPGALGSLPAPGASGQVSPVLSTGSAWQCGETEAWSTGASPGGAQGVDGGPRLLGSFPSPKEASLLRTRDWPPGLLGSFHGSVPAPSLCLSFPQAEQGFRSLTQALTDRCTDRATPSAVGGVGKSLAVVTAVHQLLYPVPPSWPEQGPRARAVRAGTPRGSGE